MTATTAAGRRGMTRRQRTRLIRGVQYAVFDVLHEHLSDEEILEFTYITMMYTMHAVICRALRLEYDNRDDPIVEIAAPEDYVAENLGRQIAYGMDRAAQSDE